MDSRSTFLRRHGGAMEGRRPEGEGTSRNVPRPEVRLLQVNPQHQAANPGQRRLRFDSHPKNVQEKLLSFESVATVLKLTQVGETSSLRRSGEHWLRNSAK